MHIPTSAFSNYRKQTIFNVFSITPVNCLWIVRSANSLHFSLFNTRLTSFVLWTKISQINHDLVLKYVLKETILKPFLSVRSGKILMSNGLLLLSFVISFVIGGSSCSLVVKTTRETWNIYLFIHNFTNTHMISCDG